MFWAVRPAIYYTNPKEAVINGRRILITDSIYEGEVPPTVFPVP